MPMPGQSCVNCFFSVSGTLGLECRANAPVANALSIAQRVVVTPDFWCGAFSTTGTPGNSIAVPLMPGVQGAQGPPGNPPPPITIAGASVPSTALYNVSTNVVPPSPLQEGTTAGGAQALSGLLPTDTVTLVFSNLPSGVTLDSVTPEHDSFGYLLLNSTSAAITMPPLLLGELTILRVQTNAVAAL
jgi:hypothetical protein